MTKSDREIMQQFPELFGTAPSTVRRSNMAFGFEIGPGWRPLLMKTLSKIAAVVKNEKIENFEIVQVKEKYASHRIYTNYCYDGIDEIIDEAKTLSETICDGCGELGTLKEIRG